MYYYPVYFAPALVLIVTHAIRSRQKFFLRIKSFGTVLRCRICQTLYPTHFLKFSSVKRSQRDFSFLYGDRFTLYFLDGNCASDQIPRKSVPYKKRLSFGTVLR